MYQPLTDKVAPPWHQLDRGNPHPRQICLNCCWWRKSGHEGPTGYCRRYAPQLSDADVIARPLVLAEEWCGDWSELVQPRLMVAGAGTAVRTWYWLADGMRSQDYDTRGAAIEAHGLGTIEWRDLD